ncbi:hypothetical protein [Streptomyces canus]
MPREQHEYARRRRPHTVNPPSPPTETDARLLPRPDTSHAKAVQHHAP